MKKTLFILLGFILVISLLLVACKSTPTTTTTTKPTTTTATTTTKPPTTAPTTTTTPTTTTATAPTGDKYGGTWVVALTVPPSRPFGYAPEAASDSWVDSTPCLEQLLTADQNGNIVPVLASSYTMAADSSSIVLNLRKNVKFHDGSDFNADVAIWNLNLNLAAKQPYTYMWKSIDKIDDYTIRVNFNQLGNNNIMSIAVGSTIQMSKAYVDKNGVDATRWHPVGTGPFIFKSYETGSKITYTRNPNYWDTGKPYLDSVVYTVIPDATIRKLAFQKGDINTLSATGLDAQTLQQAGVPIKTQAGGTYILIPDSNVATQPWSNVNVRLAASYALDRDSLVKALGYGFMAPAYQIFAGHDVCHINGLVPTTFNQAKARDLLTQAGYPTGFKTTVHSFGRMVPNDWTTAIAAQLRAVGLDVTTDFPESGAYDNLRYNGWSDGLMNHGYGYIFANPNTNLSFNIMPPMFPSLKKPVGFVEGLNASSSTPTIDPAKVKAVIQLMYDDMTVIPYFEETSVKFYKKGSNDPDADTFGLLVTIWQDCWIDKSAR